MVLLTRIYTKGGDKGKTSLGDGTRVLKSALRIQAIGSVDSTNASLGLAALHIKDGLYQDIRAIQNDLFDLGADLCIPAQSGKLDLKDQQVRWLERQIDCMNESLSPLKSFILPGGSPAAAHLHFARTLARESERLVVDLNQNEPVSEVVLRYLNRLSDYLFVAARIANDKGQNDVLWVPAGNQEKK
jgi:cob(I)alamin adenosyltransferase